MLNQYYVFGEVELFKSLKRVLFAALINLLISISSQM